MLSLAMVVSLHILVSLSYPQHANAENVTAHIYQNGETITNIDISLSPPSPNTLIVEMRLPPGSRVLKTMPPFSKQNKDDNTIKWLLKNIKEPTVTIQLVSQTRLDLGSTTVNIRYRDRNSGDLQELQVK